VVCGEQALPFPNAGTPLHLRVAYELAVRVRRGGYRQYLPWLAELQEEVNASTGTVRNALKVLEEGGWVRNSGMSGMVILPERYWPGEDAWVELLRGLAIPGSVRDRNRWRRLAGDRRWVWRVSGLGR
jgi:DNA-binding FadR family transcriptional regulator